MAKRGDNRKSSEPRWIKQMKNDQIELKHAIKLFLKEATEDRKQAAEDRKQAADDRKQAAEDRKDIKLYFSKILDEIHLDRQEARRDRKVIAALLRGFTDKQNLMIDLQQKGNKILESIDKNLRLRGNGRPNGRSRQ